MNEIDKVIEGILSVESGYSNNPDDPGKETMMGITVATARTYGYKGKMIDLSRQTAKEIYLNEYFLKPHFDKIFSISPSIAAEMMDTGVNLGVEWPAKFLQRALNALNRKQQDYKDMPVDGVIGNVTVEALKAFMVKRKELAEEIILKTLNAQQAVRYIELAEKNDNLEMFIAGWLINRVK